MRSWVCMARPPDPRPTPEAISLMQSAGANATEIAAILGKPARTVQRWIAGERDGQPLAPAPIDPELERAAISAARSRLMTAASEALERALAQQDIDPALALDTLVKLGLLERAQDLASAEIEVMRARYAPVPPERDELLAACTKAVGISHGC